MEYNLTEKSVTTAGTLLDTVGEEPVDVELTLPDYCPDIERILRCTLIPKIYMANISGDRLNIDGGACVRILYLDSAKNCVRSYEHTAPFSRSFPLKDSPERYAIYTDAKPEYINCRAMSPRKLSLHGAFSLYARVMVPKPLSYCTYDGDELQLLTHTAPISALSGICCDMFSLREDVPMNGKPEVSSVLSYRLQARPTELKAIRNKIMVTAEGKLELMYLSGENNVECMSYAFPISHIVDCDGVEDGDLIDGSLSVMTCELSVSDDALDGSSVLGLDMKLCFNALCRRQEEITLIEDAYSTALDARPQLSPLTFCCARRRLQFTDVSKTCISLDDDTLGRVIDLHCESIRVSAAVSGGAPLLSAKADVCILYENAQGEMKHICRDAEFNYNPSVENCDSVENVSARVDSLSYRIVDEKTVELRAEIAYCMTVCENISRMTVTSVTADDDTPQPRSDSTVILYYADSGERVWDISKRFRSRPADILAENGIEGDVLSDDRMLLIL